MKSDELIALIDYLKSSLKEMLSHREKMSEFEILKQLQQDDKLSHLFVTTASDSLALFRSHFLLFHVLYHLADELLLSQQGTLEISSLSIHWRDYIVGQQELSQLNKLRAFYLDWQHYENTGAREVEELIASFWLRLQANDKRSDALEILGLSDPVDDATIRKAYQRLVMLHHPDRGGDEEKMQLINAAIRLLL